MPPKVKDLFRVLDSEGNKKQPDLLFSFLCCPNANAVFWIFKRTLKMPSFVSAFVQPMPLKDRALVTMAVNRGWCRGGFLKWGEPQTGGKQSWNLLSSLGGLLFIQLNCKERLNSSLQRSKLKREGFASLEVCPWE